MMQEQGFEVSAVAIKTPFCDFDCGEDVDLKLERDLMISISI